MWRWPTLESGQSRTHQTRRSAFIRVHLRQKFPCLRRWLRVCGASCGFADLSGFMEAMCWLGVGVGKSARLTVQGINTEWFERRARAGFCLRLTVQGINTGWFERRGGTGRWCPLRRAVGGERGRQVGVAAVEGDDDPADAHQGEAVAVRGARVGAVVAMDGAGVAHPDTAPGPPRGKLSGVRWPGCVRHACGSGVCRRSRGSGGGSHVGCGRPAGQARGQAARERRRDWGWREVWWWRLVGNQGRQIGGRGGGESGVRHSCSWQHV